MSIISIYQTRKMCDKKFELKKIDQKIPNKISGRSVMQNRGNIFFLQKSKYLWKIEFFYEKKFFFKFCQKWIFLIEIIVTNLYKKTNFLWQIEIIVKNRIFSKGFYFQKSKFFDKTEIIVKSKFLSKKRFFYEESKSSSKIVFFFKKSHYLCKI